MPHGIVAAAIAGIVRVPAHHDKVGAFPDAAGHEDLAIPAGPPGGGAHIRPTDMCDVPAAHVQQMGCGDPADLRVIYPDKMCWEVFKFQADQSPPGFVQVQRRLRYGGSGVGA